MILPSILFINLFLFFHLVSVIPVSAEEAPVEAWNQTSLDGNFFLTGDCCYIESISHGDHLLIQKFNQYGEELWNWSYNTSYFTPSNPGNSIYFFFDSIIEDEDEGYLVTGNINEYEVQDNRHVVVGESGWIVKLDSNIIEKWNNTFYAGDDIRSESIAVLGDGGIIVVGQSYLSNSGERVGWMFKFSHDGKQQWNKTLYDWYSLENVVASPDGGYIVTGAYRHGQPGGDVAKFNDEGEPEWNRTYTGNIHSIITCPGGGYIMAGVIEISYTFFGWASKIDENGDEVWENRLSYPGEYGAVMANPGGGFVLAGNTGYSGLVVKLDENGRQLWTKNISIAPGSDFFNSISACPDDGYLLTGKSNTVLDYKAVSYSIMLKLEYTPAPTQTTDTPTITTTGVSTITTTTATTAATPGSPLSFVVMCTLVAVLLCLRHHNYRKTN